MNLPNKLTLARMILIVPFVAAMMADAPVWQAVATLLFVVASLTDLLDGYLARARGQVTDFGKLMDPIADKLLVMAALVGLTAQGRAHALCVMIILGREFVISGIRSVAASKGVVIAAGPIGKVKAALQMVAIALVLLPFSGPLAACGQLMLWLSAALALWSLIDYILRNKEVIAP